MRNSEVIEESDKEWIKQKRGNKVDRREEGKI